MDGGVRTNDSCDAVADPKTPAKGGTAIVRQPRPQRFTFVLWNADNTKATRLAILDDDRTLPDFVDLPDVDVLRVLIPSDKIWVNSSLMLLPFQIDSDARSVLIRYPSATRCKNFAQELRIQEDERQEDPVPPKWNYFDLRAEFPRPHLGYQFTVVAYGELDEPPTIFFVTLTKERCLRWRLYPRILQHVYLPSHDFYAWSAPTHDWTNVRPDDPFKIDDGYDFLVVRHPANPSAPRLSHFVALADQQAATPVVLFTMMLVLNNGDPPSGTFPPTGSTSDLWPVMIPCYAPATHTSPSSPHRIPTSRCLPSTEPSSPYPQTPTSSPSTRARAKPYFHARLRNPHVGKTNATMITPASSNLPSSSPSSAAASISARTPATKRTRRAPSHSDTHPMPLRRSPREPKPKASSDYATISQGVTLRSKRK